MSTLMRIEDKIGYRMKIHFLDLTKDSENILLKIYDVKNDKIIQMYNVIDNIGELGIMCKSSDMVLKISTNKKDFIHISIEFEKTEITNALEKVFMLYDNQLKETFYSNVKKFSAFPYHEEDYLFFRNFSDISDCYIVDGGVNYGQSTYSFLTAMPNIQVIGFEANPILSHILKTVSQYMNHFTIYENGLAAQSGEMKFYVGENVGISGSFIREDLGKRLKQWNSLSDIQEHIVATCSLDDKLKDKNVVFIKLDIEGYEYEALLGAKEIIKISRPILLMEYNRVSYESIVKLLEGEYKKYYYNYRTNRLVDTNECNSINYFLVPVNGTTNEYVNNVLTKLI